MRALYFPLIPRDPQLQKQQRPSAFNITGSAVYMAGFFEALVRYSSFDRFYVPDYPRGQQDDPRDSELFAMNPGRIKSLAEHQYSEMRHADHLVMAAPFQSLSGLSRIRRLSRRPRTPITAVIHSINYAQQMASMLELFLSAVEPFDALVCSSTTGRQAIENFQREIQTRLAAAGLHGLGSGVSTPVVPLGIETADFGAAPAEPLRAKLAITQEHQVLLYFGRFSASSKADLLPLLIAFADVARAHPASVLVLAGDDTHFRMAGALTRFAGDLGCGDRVRVLPNPTTSERRQLYSLADLFVSLADNLQETFGLSVVEAMAAGVPVVASDWDGYKDLVVQAETGYLIPTLMPEYPAAFDDVRGSGRMLAPDLLAATTVVEMDALKRVLNLLLTDAGHRRELGAAAQRRARALYDWREIIRQYEALWSELEELANLQDEVPSRELLDWSRWGYREMFGHYGTGFIDRASRIRITDAGREWRRRPEMLAQIAVPSTWFRPADMARLLDVLGRTEEMRLEEALVPGANPDSPASDEQAMRAVGHVCRLMKYGLVALVATAASSEVVLPSERVLCVSEGD